MRPYWKGHLKLALVSCPIALHTACSSAERIRPLFAAPSGHQPHGGAAAEHCAGPETGRQVGPSTPATRRRA